MPYILLLAIPLLIIAIVLVRTLKFKPNNYPVMRKRNQIDEKHAYESLSRLIQFKTISHLDESLNDQAEFQKLRTYLKERYPLILEHATVSEHGSGILFHIKGQSNEFPVLLMAHYDVVDVTSDWKENPFSGRINADTIYGRGTLDTKNSLSSIMEACEHLLKEKKIFRNDLYLAFSGDEEVGGHGAPSIKEHLIKTGVTPYMVLDEGGAIVSNMFPGVSKKSAVVGLSEKGFLIVKLTAKSKGGHASSPPLDTPITSLSKAVIRLNKHKTFKMKLTPPVSAMFKEIAPHSKSFAIKMMFANLWLFFPVIKMIAKKNGGQFAALLKTTQAFTMATGSHQINVLPNLASIGVDYRLRPGEHSEMVIKKIKKVIKNPDIEVEVQARFESPVMSLMDDGYKMIELAIKQTWPDVVVSPYLMTATSDSRHYHEICERVYKFSPMDVTKEDLAKIHGNDEDISLENVENGVQFYINLMDQL
jgi:carboxypeptidase PM20D1